MTTQADSDIAAKLQALQASQDAYFKAQVGTSESGSPILRNKYQQMPKVAITGGSYEVHEYDGIQGKGWILHIWITVSGVLYHRQVDFGPEQRTHGWEAT